MARRHVRPVQWKVPAFATKIWNALQRYGELRAAWELDALADRRAFSDPVLARQLRATAAEYRRGLESTPTSR
jgi:hypothetical protein